MIGGPGKKVEIDLEFAFGKRKYHRGSRRNTFWVLVKLNEAQKTLFYYMWNNANNAKKFDEHIEKIIEEDDEVINEIEFNGKKYFFESIDFEDEDEEE